MYADEDTYNKNLYWRVQPTGRSLDEYVRYKTRISLRHIETSQMLHSHRLASPITGQQEGKQDVVYAHTRAHTHTRTHECILVTDDVQLINYALIFSIL